MAEQAGASVEDRSRLVAVTLDQASIGRNNAEVEHEREVAIFDLLEKNSFALEGHDGGPYTLNLSLADNRLVFTVGDSRAPPHRARLRARRSRPCAAASGTRTSPRPRRERRGGRRRPCAQ